MKTGEIFFWNTTKARGHETRNKFHMFVRETDWQFGNTFLFISKLNYFNDFQITKTDYPFLPLPISYISCEEPITYTDEELARLTLQPMGKLIDRHFDDLANHLLGHEVMEKRHIDRICKALRAAE